MQDDALEVTHRLSRAIERGKFALLKDRAQGLLGGRPGAAGLLQTEVVERGLDGHNHVALERVLRVGNAEGVTLAKSVGRRRCLRTGNVKRGKGVGRGESGLL